MNQETIRAWTRRPPFQPFRVKMTDGTLYEIRHPDMILADRNSLSLVAPTQKDSSIEDHLFAISYFHIMEIEPLPPLPTQQDNLKNGQHP